MRVSQAAVQFVRAFTAADGLTLSDRLWRLDQGAKEPLQRAIGSAVVQGWSASRAAPDLAYQGHPVPPELAATLRNAGGNALQRLGDLLVSGDGAEIWKAERVFRTEINRAHGEASMAAGERTPGFAGGASYSTRRTPSPTFATCWPTRTCTASAVAFTPPERPPPGQPTPTRGASSRSCSTKM